MRAPDLLAELAALEPAGICVKPLGHLQAVEITISGQPPARLLVGVQHACDLALRLAGAAAAVRRYEHLQEHRHDL